MVQKMKQRMMMIHKMFQDSYVDAARVIPEDDWINMIAEEYPIEIDDEDVWCCTKTSYDI